jgi:4-amino-4-deoxy-L-arabinose transferase-like glycosyltransferase
MRYLLEKGEIKNKENTFMSKTPELTTPTEYDEPLAEPKRVALSSLWERVALGGVMLISLFMNFFKLGQNGFDTYYPPAVRSMMDNWHNFFFAAYDPGGFTSLDKPPVGFWLQVASAKLFGFTPFSVLLPQALAGVLSVLLLYYLVRRHFGVVAGLFAALALALSPISVVTNRNVTIDSTLTLTLLLGAWAVLRAAETGKLRWLLLSAVIVGVGFNIKMLEAYLVVPAYGVLYLLAAPRSIWKRVGHLALAALVLLVVSFSWALAVDLTPASQRPHVGSTQDNSEISLALGYNGLQRLLGLGGAPIQDNSRSWTGVISIGGNGGPTQLPKGAPKGSFTAPAGFGGAPGPLHLFTQPLAGQNGWLLPLAIFGMIALAWQGRPRPQRDRKFQSLVLWGTWLLTMGIFFSVAGFIHEYYLTVMAPAIAALCGIGLVTMWQDYRRSGWRGWLLPLALIGTAAEQVYILTSYPAWGRWMIPLISVLCVLAVGVLLGARLASRFTSKAKAARFLLPALAIGVVALMLSPTLWAAIPILQGTEGDLPLAGPMQGSDSGIGGKTTAGSGPAGMGVRATVDPRLLRYLEENQGKTPVLVATDGMADGIILATNKSVIPLAGFSSYPLTTTELASLVAKGTVRFFLLDQMQIPEGVQVVGGGSGNDQLSAITTWVTQHCKAVPPSLWQSSSTGAGTGASGQGGANQLYDCATTH